MAIKVNGTTVVDDSRNLTNIASIDATTEAAISAAGFSQTTGDITGVTAGSGLTGGGSSGTVTINHQDTSSQGSVNNSGNTVIQDITLDTYGHITGINSTTIDAGASTTYAAVGTYTAAGIRAGSNRAPDQTVSGSSLVVHSDNRGAFTDLNNTKEFNVGLSGTWRQMAWQRGYYGDPFFYFGTTLWVRIS